MLVEDRKTSELFDPNPQSPPVIGQHLIGQNPKSQHMIGQYLIGQNPKSQHMIGQNPKSQLMIRGTI